MRFSVKISGLYLSWTDTTYIPIQGYHPYAFLEDSNGTFWVGETTGRLSIFDRSSQTYTKSYDHVSSSFITHIAQDLKDPSILWLTTHKDGLVKFNTRTEEVKSFRHQAKDKNSLSSNSVWGFGQEDDVLWLGTWGGGLNRFDKETEKFTVYKHNPKDPESISSNVCGNLLITSLGDLYISTLGGGLNKFNKETQTFEHYSTENGLFPSDNLEGILEDKQGNLWIASSTEEVIKFDPKTLVYKAYGPGDGIEIGGPWFVANYKTRDGQMWFGGPKGVTAFYPENIKDNLFKPPVYITSLSQGGEPIKTDKALEKLSELKISWERPFFEFEATALNYTRPEHNRYRYKLEGWDKEWFNSGLFRSGRYSNLKGGKYILRISGSNNDGIWCAPEQEVALEIIVNNPFWKTGWFIALVAAVGLITLLFVVFYMRKLQVEVTNRKRAQEALVNQKYFLQKAQEIGQIGTWELNIKKNELLWTDENYRIFGLPIGTKLTYETFLDCVHPDDREYVDKEWKAAFDKKPYDIEHRLLIDGKVKWVREKAELHFNEKDECIRGTGVTQDITERKRTEEVLKERESLFSQMFEQSTTSMCFYNPDGTVNRVNDEFCKMFGVEEKVIIDAGYNVFKDQAAIDAGILSLLRDIFEEKNTKHWEINFDIDIASASTGTPTSRTGKIFIEVFGYPVLNREGNLEYVVLQHYDITDRKRAEEALKENEKRYKEAQRMGHVGNWEYELETENFWGSQEAKRIYGFDPESKEFTTEEVESCIPERERLHQALLDLIEKNIPYNLEFEIRPVSGPDKKIIKSIAEVTRDASGVPMKVVGVIQDITQQKETEKAMVKLERQLRQSQKMEAIGTLAGGIAHDFNNLLMAIQGRTSIMLMKKDSSHPDIRHLKGIEDNVESAADLTRQLLGFARGGKYEVKPTDLNELVKKENRMFGRTKKEITIHGKYAEDLWSVEIDRGQIEQVLLNLYVNAWQAMPGGGDLYLETENVTLDEIDVEPFSIEPGEYVKISVTDTGFGMDKATLEKIFEPFFTTKEMGKSTGLGLASVYGIIKNHGGFIDVHSEKGHGSTFNIYLPASEKEVIEEKKAAVDTLRGTETVLFVDDEDMIIEVAGELFEQLGYKVLTAGSGREAIEAYEKNKEKIDIVLLDMIMPDMSGGDTYDKLKEINPDVKVLLASGYSMIGTATEIMGRGCSGFIQKPFKMKELSQKLREILDKK